MLWLQISSRLHFYVIVLQFVQETAIAWMIKYLFNGTISRQTLILRTTSFDKGYKCQNVFITTNTIIIALPMIATTFEIIAIALFI